MALLPCNNNIEHLGSTTLNTMYSNSHIATTRVREKPPTTLMLLIAMLLVAATKNDSMTPLRLSLSQERVVQLRPRRLNGMFTREDRLVARNVLAIAVNAEVLQHSPKAKPRSSLDELVVVLAHVAVALCVRNG